MVCLYYHGGSLNHGCEAIVRSTVKNLKLKPTLYTTNIQSDEKYGLDVIVRLKEDNYTAINNNFIKSFLAAIYFKLIHTDYLYVKYSRQSFFSQVKRNDVCMSIGGDNYCYSGNDILGYYNRAIHNKRAKTVLWGCSFEPSDLTEMVAKDIALYDLIIARESISYEVLSKVNKNVKLIPDPAFLLDKVELDLPKGFAENNTIGINVSPLIMKCETNEGATETNYRNLIKYIIDKTNMQIALIPHVVEEGNDDRVPLDKLYQEFEGTGRVVKISDCNAMELKGYIARCRYFIGARTHATIAAYSTCVPTLVVGYSVKARGIAKDIFSTYNNYVIPVQSLKNENDLIEGFRWLEENEKSIRNHLNSFMPSYCEKVWQAGELVRELLN